jgi:hypothetical protein
VTYGEEKTFTVELGKRLFDVSSKFTADGKPAADLPICIGVTTHDGKATASHNKDRRWVACWEVLDGHGLGTGARLGEGYPIEIKEVTSEEKDVSHIFIITQTDKDGALTYQAGYGWEKAGEIKTQSDWENYLNSSSKVGVSLMTPIPEDGLHSRRCVAPRWAARGTSSRREFSIRKKSSASWNG